MSCNSCSGACSCKALRRGPTGPTGAGPTGTTGATGTTGPTGSAFGSAFANFFDAVLGPIAADAPLPLSIPAVVPSGITNVAGVLTIAQAGTYSVTLSVRIAPSSPLPETTTLDGFQNGTFIPGASFTTTLNTAGEDQSLAGTFLINAGAGDTLEIRNGSGGSRSLDGRLVVFRIAP